MVSAVIIIRQEGIIDCIIPGRQMDGVLKLAEIAAVRLGIRFGEFPHHCTCARVQNPGRSHGWSPAARTKSYGLNRDVLIVGKRESLGIDVLRPDLVQIDKDLFLRHDVTSWQQREHDGTGEQTFHSMSLLRLNLRVWRTMNGPQCNIKTE